MNKFAIALLLTINTGIGCMEQPGNTPSQVRPSWIRKGDFTLPFDSVENTSHQEEAFNHYFYDLEKTDSDDDTLKTTVIRTSLFMQLCVQASKTNGPRLRAFREFLSKIKNNDFEKLGTNELCVYNNVAVTDDTGITVYNNIKAHMNQVGITKKDARHRLLSCIPTASTCSLINGKKVRLDLQQSETDPNKHCLLADYFFETDTAHHNTILQEFKSLIHQEVVVAVI